MKLRVPDTLFARFFGLLFLAIIVSHVMTFALTAGLIGFPRPPMGPPPPGMRGDGPPPMPPPHLARLWITLLVQFVALTVAAWFGARMLARPMQRLTQAAERLGENLNTPPIEEDGPAEARMAAHVFNQMQDRIRLQLQEKGRFLASVSHDLRTPLTRLKLRIERLPETDDKAKLRNDIVEMATMLNATLDYLRGEALGEPWQLLDLRALVYSMAEDIQENGGDIDVEGDAKPLPAQPAALRRCISNLVENALRYGQSARLSLHDEGEFAVVEIRDNGPGIPEEHLKAVFEPFFRLESSRNKATGGIGLGLSIAREIARRHGGELSLRNADGGGLIARLSLSRYR